MGEADITTMETCHYFVEQDPGIRECEPAKRAG